MIVVIESYETLNCSVWANPRYRVHTNDGTYITSSDSPASYEIPNNVGKCVKVDLTRAGRITKVHPL